MITQDTGFGCALPTGEGLFGFSTMEDILAAVDAINGGLRKPACAAATIARELLSYDVVLPKMIDDIGLTARHSQSPRSRILTQPESLVLTNVDHPRDNPTTKGIAPRLAGLSSAARREFLWVFAHRERRVAQRAGPMCVLWKRPVCRWHCSTFPTCRPIARGIGDIDVDNEYPFDVNLICADVELHFSILSHFGDAFFKDRYNVGIWAWELPRFPKSGSTAWPITTNLGSVAFIAESLSSVSPIPVVACRRRLRCRALALAGAAASDWELQ